MPQAYRCPWCIQDFFDVVGTVEDFDWDMEFFTQQINATVATTYLTCQHW